MTFFYDLNKRLAALADKQDLHESKVAESEKWIQKAVDPSHKGDLHKALHVAQDKKIPKAKIEKATHSKNPKLRHMAQFAKNVANEEIADEGNAFTGALAKTPKGGKFKVGGKEFKDTSSIEEGTCPGCKCSPCECVEEGNAFTGKLKTTPKGGKFKLGNKEFTDNSEIEEGFADMDAWLAQREKEKGTGKFDRKERTLPSGMKATTYTRRHDDEEDDAEVSTEPKRRGRPKGAPKGPERVTAKSYKYKAGRPAKTNEGDLEGSQDHDEAGEFGAEGDYVKNELHTMVRVARDLEKHLRDNEDLPTWCIGKLSQAKGMVVSVMDYIMSEKERGIEATTGEEGITLEKAPPGAKAERMVKHIKAGYAKDGKLTDKEKSIAYATAWKAKKAGKVEEESTDKEDTNAEKAGKKVAKDIEHDEGHKAKDDNRAEKAGKKVTKDIEYDDKKDKEEKVDETTVAGSVATSVAAPKASKGMQFGKGVYESLDRQFKQALTESIAVESKMEECDMGGQSITIQADGEEAAKLMALLKLAGLEGCPTCGKAPCGCEELDENSPDWPTNTEVGGKDDPTLQMYAGGLNKPKSTGQTTVPVIASQSRRQVSMEESVELERTLFKTWKNYKG
jgi:hypothetical protein